MNLAASGRHGPENRMSRFAAFEKGSGMTVIARFEMRAQRVSLGGDTDPRGLALTSRYFPARRD